MIQEGVSDTFQNSDLKLRDGVAHICSTRSLICKLIQGDNGTHEGRVISGTYVHPDLSRYPVNHI